MFGFGCGDVEPYNTVGSTGPILSVLDDIYEWRVNTIVNGKESRSAYEGGPKNNRNLNVAR
jgi:hypothetical protein